jgi:phosphoenolpyruvate synthase/pyruvate phosphate dikinase
MKTHEKKWEDQGGCVFLVEMVHRGDTVKMNELIGFNFNKHYLSVRKGAMSFYASKETMERAKEFGNQKFVDLDFIEDYFKKIREIGNTLKETVKKIKETDLSKVSNEELYSLYIDFFEKYSALLGLYRFSRPEFYDDVIKNLIKKFPEPNAENFNALLSNKQVNFKVDENVKELALTLKQVGDIRLDMHKTWQITYNEVADNLFNEIGKRIKISSLEAMNCLTNEIKEALLSDKKIDIDEIKKRINFFNIIYTDDFSFKIDFDESLNVEDEEKVDEIKGTSAYPGKVKGPVKLILNSIQFRDSDHLDIEEGCILVTGNTSPDLVPILNKVSAIVTDEGGLLCHAAIVSREMKKPCIIGTKNATKVLKDGDLIEVDADKGIVRRIEND